MPRTSPLQLVKGGRTTTAHHFVWYACCDGEVGLLEGDTAWCTDSRAVQAREEEWSTQSRALVEADAETIGGWDEPPAFYASYLYSFVHLEFPGQMFQTRKAATQFLLQAFASDDPESLLEPYRGECVSIEFKITEDEETHEAHISESAGHEEWADFIKALTNCSLSDLGRR